MRKQNSLNTSNKLAKEKSVGLGCKPTTYSAPKSTFKKTKLQGVIKVISEETKHYEFYHYEWPSSESKLLWEKQALPGRSGAKCPNCGKDKSVHLNQCGADGESWTMSCQNCYEVFADA